MSNDEKVIMNMDSPAFKYALLVANTMNTGNQWAVLHVHHDRIYIEYGTIHTNGDHEQAIGTIHYGLNKAGQVVTHRIIHP